MVADSRFSPHPTDALIRQLILADRAATPEELNQIIRRMAGAPFPTARNHRDRHTADGQWTEPTTVEQYADDLRRAISDTTARPAIYIRRGGNIAVVLAATERIVPADRRGPTSAPLLFVVHSADRGMLITGYQASSLARISLPEGVRWLR